MVLWPVPGAREFATPYFPSPRPTCQCSPTNPSSVTLWVGRLFPPGCWLVQVPGRNSQEGGRVSASDCQGRGGFGDAGTAEDTAHQQRRCPRPCPPPLAGMQPRGQSCGRQVCAARWALPLPPDESRHGLMKRRLAPFDRGGRAVSTDKGRSKESQVHHCRPHLCLPKCPHPKSCQPHSSLVAQLGTQSLDETLSRGSPAAA